MSSIVNFERAAHLAVANARTLLPEATCPVSLRNSILAVHAVAEQLRVVEAELLAEAKVREAWVGTGARDIADWLAGATKSSYGDAKRKERLGSAMKTSDALKAAVEAGSVSADTAEQLAATLIEPPEGAGASDLAELVEACSGASPTEAREAAALFASTFTDDAGEEAAAERRHQARSLSFGTAPDGMVAIRGSLPAASADQVKKSLLHAAGPYDGDQRTHDQRLADGLTNLATAYAKGEVTGGREAPQMTITMTEASLIGTSNEPALTDLGTHIPAHEARRLAAIAEVRRVVMAGSAVIDLGRSYRAASLQQYHALVARDGGCVWPGCSAPAAWCEVDHIVPWEVGGRTDLSQLALLCPHHHRERHRPRVFIEGDAATWKVHLADGRVLPRRPVRHPDRQPGGEPAREPGRQPGQRVA